MNVETSNALGKVILNTASSMAGVSLAAVWTGSPIGALGGAIYGGVLSLSETPLRVMTSKLFNTQDVRASTEAKTVANALRIFGEIALAWAVVTAAGMTMSVGTVVWLSLVSSLSSAVVVLYLAYIAGQQMHQNRNRV